MSESPSIYGKQNDQSLHWKSENGVEVSYVSDFEEIYQISKRQMATYLGVSEKTYYNMMNDQLLDTHRSDKFLQLSKVFTEGVHTFMSKEGFQQWLDTPQLAFGNRKPSEYLHTFSGLDEVYTELQRIKFGVLA